MSFMQNAKQLGKVHARLQVFTPRLAWMVGLALLFAGAIALAFLVEDPTGDERAELFTVYLLAGPLGFLAPFFALVASQSLASDDLEGGMGSYLFVRPISRPAMLLGRAVVSGLVLCALLTLGTVAVAGLAGFSAVGVPMVMALLVTLLAIPLYLGLFTLMSFLVKSSVAVGFGFIALVDLIVAGLPFRVHVLAPRYHLLALWAQWTKAATGSYPEGGFNWAQHLSEMPATATLTGLLALTALLWYLAVRRLSAAEV